MKNSKIFCNEISNQGITLLRAKRTPFIVVAEATTMRNDIKSTIQIGFTNVHINDDNNNTTFQCWSHFRESSEIQI